MVKKFIIAISFALAPIMGNALWGNACFVSVGAYAAAPTNGDYYSKTGQRVDIYSESGTYKGSFDVYLHKGKKYISFQNTWICIQGKSRFGYNGNWYIIK